MPGYYKNHGEANEQFVYVPHIITGEDDGYGPTGEMIVNDDPNDHFEIVKLANEAQNSGDKSPAVVFLNAVANHYWDTPTHVVVYELDRACYSSAEGGCYYTTYSMVEATNVSEQHDNWNSIIAHAETLASLKRAEFPDHGQLGSYGDSAHYAFVIETTDEPGYSERKPAPVYC